MSLTLFIGAIGGPELLIILLIAVFLFGADKLPKLARSSGQAMGEFQKGRETIEEDIRSAASDAKGSGAESDADDAVAEPRIEEDAAARDPNPA